MVHDFSTGDINNKYTSSYVIATVGRAAAPKGTDFVKPNACQILDYRINADTCDDQNKYDSLTLHTSTPFMPPAQRKLSCKRKKFPRRVDRNCCWHKSLGTRAKSTFFNTV